LSFIALTDAQTIHHDMSVNNLTRISVLGKDIVDGYKALLQKLEGPVWRMRITLHGDDTDRFPYANSHTPVHTLIGTQSNRSIN